MNLTSSSDTAKALVAAGDRWQQAAAFDRAIATYRQALALEPQESVAFNNQAVACRLKSDLVRAASCLHRALALVPAFPSALLNLGEVLVAGGAARPRPLRRLLALLPACIDGLRALGDAAAAGGPYEAERWYRASLTLDPTAALVWRNLGVVAKDRRRAGAAYLRALQPVGVPAAWGTEAAAALAGAPPGAIRQLAALCPALGPAWTEIGQEAQGRHAHDEAERCYLRVLAADALDGAAAANLATTRTCQGRLDEARQLLRQAGALDPGRPEIRYNLAHVLLALGDVAEGWSSHEHRWRIATYPSPAFTPGIMTWSGRPAPDATLLVAAEQGLGDCIQFARYVRAAAQRTGRVLVKVPGPLCELLRGAGLPASVLSNGEPTPPHHLKVGLMSLPFRLGEASPPDGTPYLATAPERVDTWRRRMGEDGFRIGLSWQGSRSHPYDALRSLDPERLRLLSGLPGVRLLSLQHDSPAPAWLEPLAGRFGEDGDAFVDMAAAMMTLDLVITVDTSVAHLAGALGRPVWTLLATTTDWRWGRASDTTPWYSTMRLFRQATPRDWATVVDDVRTALRRIRNQA